MNNIKNKPLIDSESIRADIDISETIMNKPSKSRFLKAIDTIIALAGFVGHYFFEGYIFVCFIEVGLNAGFQAMFRTNK